MGCSCQSLPLLLLVHNRVTAVIWETSIVLNSTTYGERLPLVFVCHWCSPSSERMQETKSPSLQGCCLFLKCSLSSLDVDTYSKLAEQNCVANLVIRWKPTFSIPLFSGIMPEVEKMLDVPEMLDVPDNTVLEYFSEWFHPHYLHSLPCQTGPADPYKGTVSIPDDLELHNPGEAFPWNINLGNVPHALYTCQSVATERVWFICPLRGTGPIPDSFQQLSRLRRRPDVP